VTSRKRVGIAARKFRPSPRLASHFLGLDGLIGRLRSARGMPDVAAREHRRRYPDRGSRPIPTIAARLGSTGQVVDCCAEPAEFAAQHQRAATTKLADNRPGAWDQDRAVKRCVPSTKKISTSKRQAEWHTAIYATPAPGAATPGTYVSAVSQADPATFISRRQQAGGMGYRAGKVWSAAKTAPDDILRERLMRMIDTIARVLAGLRRPLACGLRGTLARPAARSPRPRVVIPTGRSR